MRDQAGTTTTASMKAWGVVLVLGALVAWSTVADMWKASGLSRQYMLQAAERLQLREEVREMFYHAYSGYRRCAFPKDELRPLSCGGLDSPLLGGHALTLVDALDTLYLLGNVTEFASGVRWVADNLRFDKDVVVSVFEANIRLVGGLLSAHFIAADPSLNAVPRYGGELLRLAEDLAQRLLPAFNTDTGIPYGSVNLRHGVSRDETPITSTAGGGTYLLEFGLLSRLTGNPVYEEAARRAMYGLWSRRSPMDLVGNHINVQTGEWTHKGSGVGAGIDSFFEYMLKGAALFSDADLWDMFISASHAVEAAVFKNPWYVEVHMDTGTVVWPLVNSLGNFWPGLRALAGETESASRSLRSLHEIWRKYGAVPEGYNVDLSGAHPGQRGYPLRPELAESAYLLYRTTGDRSWWVLGRDMVTGLQQFRTKHGYAAVEDVTTRSLRDNMDSFFLAETLKYLFLLFDDDNYVSRGQYVFNTEGHPFPFNRTLLQPPPASVYQGELAYAGRCPRRTYSSLLSVDGLVVPQFRELNSDSTCTAV